MLVYIGALSAVLIFVSFVAIFAIQKKRNDIADVIWGLGFVVSAAGAIFIGDPDLGTRELVILGVLTIWALRLTYFLGLRNLKKSEEDLRYQKMRSSWEPKHWVLKSYFYVFIFQALLLTVINLSVLQALAMAPQALDFIFFVGLSLWIFGFIFESVADEQLKQFKNQKNKTSPIMNQGLWSWSRHPNYFGEVVQWWGLWLMCLNVSQPYQWWTVISPILITYLIIKVSGIPMLEVLMKDRPGYQDYAQRTSKFFPWPPKK